MLFTGWVICQALMLVGTLYGLYQVFIALPLTKWPPRIPTKTEPYNRFAVLVFAKDEELVIGNLLDSLNTQNYPKEAFDIFVTADNCTDDTGAVAAERGATVWERTDTSRIGKGYALHWFFERFRKKHAAKYDACVIFDADNVVDPGFLSAMNDQLNAGHEIAVGYRMGKNPTSSWVAGMTTIFWLLQIRFAHRARMRRGMSCLSVGGTGFMFSLSALPGCRWNTQSNTEDIEFTMGAIAAGKRVWLATDAEFFDEQPISFSSSMTQRYRWSVGTFQTMGLSLGKLWAARRTAKTKDAILFMIGTPIAAVSTILTVLSTVLLALWTPSWIYFLISTLGFGIVAFIITSWIAWLTLKLEKTTWPGKWKSILGFPIFMVSWTMLYVAVLFYRNPAWKPIPHTDTMGLDKMIRRQRSLSS